MKLSTMDMVYLRGARGCVRLCEGLIAISIRVGRMTQHARATC